MGGRALPEVELTPPLPGYADLLAHGYDWFELAWNLQPRPALLDLLEDAKAEAKTASPDGSLPALRAINGQEVGVRSYGGQGTPWLIDGDGFVVAIRNPGSNFPISVRMTAAGLWQWGPEALRDRAYKVIEDSDGPDGGDWERVSRVDYAFDMSSPAFTAEMVPDIARAILAPAGVKVHRHGDMYGANGTIETLAVGMRAAPLQIVIYDKGREIRQASGKTWMYELWERSGWVPPEHGEPVEHVWRVEVRMRKDWLRKRGVLNQFHLRDHLPELLAEALLTRRLTVPTADTNRARWPVHPLWTMALNCRPATEFAPLGERVTKRAGEIASILADMMAGVMRTGAMLLPGGNGDFQPGMVDALIDEALERMNDDPLHAEKVALARAKYRNVNKPR